MKKYEGKEERISGVWYPATIKADNYKQAVKGLFVGKRKSYGIVEAVRGRWVEVK